MKFKVFLINLDKSTERREKCEAELNKYGIPFERVAGVYGNDVPDEEVERVYDSRQNQRRYKKVLGRGEIGCYLSHIKCWQKIVDDGLDYAVILEDDFKLNDAFKDFEGLFEQLQDWDYVRLAFSSRNVPICQREPITSVYDLVYYKKVPINTLAQAVSLQGAKKLLENSKCFFRPVDVDMKHYWEKGINVLGIDPPLIKDRFDFSSEIERMSKGKGRVSSGALTKNIRYALDYKVKFLYFEFMKKKLSNFIRKNE